MKDLIKKILREGLEQPWIDKTSNYEHMENIFHSLNMVGWTYKVLEANIEHEFCPIGFDVDVDKVKKHVTLNVCTITADNHDFNDFWDTVEQEIHSELHGWNTA